MSQKFVPSYVCQESFVALLDDVRQRVASGDSFEGSLSYEFPWDGDEPKGFRVRASYRIGNSEGQGGMRMIGEWVDE
jgi:hypothetical protein